MLKLCVWVRTVVVCAEGAMGTVEGACLWCKSVETAKGVQLETVMGTLLVGGRGVDVSLEV